MNVRNVRASGDMGVPAPGEIPVSACSDFRAVTVFLVNGPAFFPSPPGRECPLPGLFRDPPDYPVTNSFTHNCKGLGGK
jgi:hypothetical protein